MLNKFHIIRKIGPPIVVEFASPKTKIAIKISLIKDLGIIYQLNELQNLTPFFIYTHGWFSMNGIPEMWRDTVDEYPEEYDHSILLCQVMDLPTYKFDDKGIRLTELEYRQILYIMVHGIELAKTKFGYKHGNLHAGQIFLRINGNPQLTISNTTIKMGRFCPKLIDFTYDSKEKDDIDTLISIVRNKMYQQKNRSLIEFEEYAKIRNDSYFDSIIIKRNVEPLKHHCMVCHDEATLEWQNTFCSKECSDYWEPLRGIVWQNSAHSY
jgi:hypothetical protein